MNQKLETIVMILFGAIIAVAAFVTAADWTFKFLGLAMLGLGVVNLFLISSNRCCCKCDNVEEVKEEAPAEEPKKTLTKKKTSTKKTAK